ncbi:hypothetical protein MTO96_031382 [Rhipicephalus appendiculatus]
MSRTGAPAAFVTKVVSPYLAGAYSGYGRYGYSPYASATGEYGYPPHGRQGYTAGARSLRGFANGGQSPYRFGAGCAPGPYGVPAGSGSWPSAHHGYCVR